MEPKLQLILDKLKIVAGKTGKVAETAGKKASEMAQITKLNLQIFDLHTSCEALYQEIGRMVYQIHAGEEVDSKLIDEKIEEISKMQEKITDIRAQVAGIKTVCPSCGKQCDREDSYCPRCGDKLPEE